MEADAAHAAHAAHAMYARLGFVVVSGKMSAMKSAAGVWKKHFAFPPGWQLRTSSEYNARATGFAVVTGPASRITAIDIDDAETETNKRLMRLMEPCTLIAKTKKGFHYVFRYDARILQTAGDKLDTRNAGGCIFVAPSVAYDDQGRTVAEYSWVRQPPLVSDEPLVAVPEAVVDFLRALDRRYVVAASVSGPAPPPPDAATQGAQGAQVAQAAQVAPSQPHTDTARDGALMSQALRAAQARAGATNTDRVGYPTRVVPIAGKPPIWGSPAVRIEFSHRRGHTRVCPVTRMEHDSNHFFVALGVEEERTGLPAFFLYCHDTNECNPHRRHQMLAFVDPESYEALGIDTDEIGLQASPETTRSIGQTIVLLGKMQEQVDRLMENPGGAWDTVIDVGFIASALCTAASRHVEMLPVAKAMLAQIIGASRMSDAEKQHAANGFQHGRAALDPLGTVRAYAEGLLAKRDQELMVIREAIVANTRPALEADVPNAAENLLKALDTLVYVEADGTHGGYTDVVFGGKFVFYVWNRVARLAFDKWMIGEKKHEFYLFNGATYDVGQKDNFVQDAFEHLKVVAEALREIAPLRVRAEKLVRRIAGCGDYCSKITQYALAQMQKPDMLASCGHISASAFHDALDKGPYIGFTNGVMDTERGVFMPIGHVGRNVLVSMSTKYAFVYPDDPRVPTFTAEIDSYYATLFAGDAADDHDALLHKAKIMTGSFLYPGNIAKAMHVWLGHDGNNGKSAFAEFLRLTLGDYYATGNIGALTPGSRETLDVEILRNYKALVCAFPEAQSSDRDGHSMGLKLDSGKLKVLTGNDSILARGLYRNPESIKVKYKPFAVSNSMPELDHTDEPARDRVRVTRFGSKFSTSTEDNRRRIYKCIPNMDTRLVEWAPFHMVRMLEWLAWFNAAGNKLAAGDEHTEGSFANRAVIAQTPEGKLRAWVDADYTLVPLKEKDSGTKLEVLYTAYTAMAPPVHTKVLGRNHFAKMLESIYPGIGPHRSADTRGLYLLR